MRLALAIGLASFLMLPIPATAQQTSTSEGVFSEEQVTLGEGQYRSACARCHGANLERTDPEAANLTGAAFDLLFVGNTLRERYERIFYTMPVNNPGSLDPVVALNILVYILAFNGVPTGEDDLPLDMDLLETIVIDKPN
jgi:hypothetical protein